MNNKIKILVGFLLIFFIVCAFVVWMGDFKFPSTYTYLPNMIVGIITLVGGFLLAYIWIEHERIKRDKEDAKREIERKQRVLRSLHMFKNFLLPWVFNLATTISDHFLLYDRNRFFNGSYHDDIPELEDIFGISESNKDGTRIRGTNKASEIDAEIRQLAIDTNDIRITLTYGIDVLRHVEDKLREFTNLLEMIDEGVSGIVHLPILLRERDDELRRWEHERSRNQLDINFLDNTGASDNIKTNLRIAGRSALNIILAIESNMTRLEQEIQN